MNKETKKVVLYLMKNINKKLNLIFENNSDQIIKIMKIMFLLENLIEDNKIKEIEKKWKIIEKNIINSNYFNEFYSFKLTEDFNLKIFLDDLKENKQNE